MLTNKDRVTDVRDIMWAAGEGRRDRRAPIRRASTNPSWRSTLYGWDKAHPDDPALASQVLRPMRQHSGLSGLAAVADEQARQALSRRDRPDLLHGVELSWLRHRQCCQPGRRVPAQLSPGLRLGQVAGPAGRLLLTRWSTAALRSATTRKCASILMHSAELREQVKKILGKLGRLVDGKLLIPEEIVHYSEWVARDASSNQPSIRSSTVSDHPRHHPPGLPRLQDGAARRDL